MVKKITLLYLLIIFILVGCSSKDSTSSSIENKSEVQISSVYMDTTSDKKEKSTFIPNLSGIKEIMNLKKEQVLEVLGANYKVIKTGVEDSEEGFYFEKYGMTIVFDDFSEPGMIARIECTEKVDVNGTKVGMSIPDIEKIMGKGNISELNQNEQDQPKYELDYKYDDFIVWYGSVEKDGKTIVLEIRKNYMD